MKPIRVITFCTLLAILSGGSYAVDRFSFHHRVSTLQKALDPVIEDFPNIKVAFSCAHNKESVCYFGLVESENEKQSLIQYLSEQLDEDAGHLCSNVRLNQEDSH